MLVETVVKLEGGRFFWQRLTDIWQPTNFRDVLHMKAL